MSHFKTQDSLGSSHIDTGAFCSQYFSVEQRTGYDGKAYSFFLGHLVHLLSDIEWQKRIVEPLLSAHKDESHGDLSRAFTYLTQTQANAFVEEAATAITMRLNEILV